MTMSTDGRRMQRGGVGGSTACVDVGAALDEQPPDFRLAAHGRLVQRRPANPDVGMPGPAGRRAWTREPSASRSLSVAGTSPDEHAQKMSEASAFAPCAMR